jgi:hypothetical protein
MKALNFTVEQGNRTGNKQGDAVMKTEVSCKRYRIIPITRKKSNSISLLVPCSTLFGIAVYN